MTERIAVLLESVPAWVGVLAGAAAWLLAGVGAALILLAASYGDPIPAYWSAGAFVASAAAWHIADGLSHR
ncbi:MAG: hypothetical protein QY307_11315 [Acidimicrobiia bacterium]|nr:MAG: hypothetical protein QY307_11315 [Acidimicrobiia bacterium]